MSSLPGPSPIPLPSSLDRAVAVRGVAVAVGAFVYERSRVDDPVGDGYAGGSPRRRPRARLPNL